MPELVEVAIEKALLTKAQAFATAQGLGSAISLPNIAFTPPTASQTAKWLRATFLPVPSTSMGVQFDSHVQHNGIMQIDVMYGQGAGEYALSRIASDAIKFFARGTKLPFDGITVRIDRAPYRGPMIKDDVWMMIPVSIPYLCFARPN